jgi:hypothetical protein
MLDRLTPCPAAVNLALCTQTSAQSVADNWDICPCCTCQWLLRLAGVHVFNVTKASIAV